MLRRLKEVYTRWGFDTAPRENWRYKAHLVFRFFVRGIKYFAAPLMVVLQSFRIAMHGQVNWYKIQGRSRAIQQGFSAIRARLPQTKNHYHFKHTFTYIDEHVRFNIDKALSQSEVRGVALIFFMGMGDYFYTTPLIAALKQRYPSLPFIAYVSRHISQFNNPSVALLLKQNPHIDTVIEYDGKAHSFFKNYDYTDALKYVPADHLAIPVLYEHLPKTSHRVLSLFDTFGVDTPAQLPLPQIYTPPKPAPHVEKLLEKIMTCCRENKARGIVFMQLDMRSSRYSYPSGDQLATGLEKRGYYVISASKLTAESPMHHQLDLSTFSIIDSIHLLKLLRDHFPTTYTVGTISVFWSISSGFDIPTLGLHHFIDPSMHNVWYPNTHVITHYDYEHIPADKKFIAFPDDYTINRRGQVDFHPNFVLRCFDEFSNEQDSKHILRAG
jgi:hypothetical protein